MGGTENHTPDTEGAWTDRVAGAKKTDYYVVSDKTKRDASSAWTRSYRTRSGTQKVERVDRPAR
ncbi:hypothetical protein [Streptomyces sp. NPDC048411]|uniref:hypothetical protein n=1 Tax=Streptomyces sp. NPDC048411 TaxID=3157206 RepID=UPI003452862B